MVTFASPSFFYFPLYSSSNQIITEILHRKHHEQNLIRCSKEEFNKISIKSKLKNRQINPRPRERFVSTFKITLLTLNRVCVTYALKLKNGSIKSGSEIQS